MCEEMKPCDRPCVTEPTPAQVCQLFAMVGEREDSLRRDKLAREERERREERRSRDQLREAIAEVLHGQGVGWLWNYGGEFTEVGRWESCVDLMSVSFKVPGFRPFTVYMGKTEGKPRAGSTRGSIFYQWQPAGFQTGDEVATWCGTDKSGTEVSCNCFREALCISAIRPALVELNGMDGQNPPDAVI